METFLDLVKDIWDFLKARDYDMYTLHRKRINDIEEYFSLFDNTSELRLVCSPTESESLWK